MDLYQELDLPRDCSFEDIKQQYRILARVHHPDMGGDEEKFKKIKFAYEVLSDPDRRAEYDRSGNTQKVPDIHEQAIQNLSQIFLSMLPNFDPDTGNIIEAIKIEINKALQAMANSKNEYKVYIDRLEITKTKIRKKDDTENLFYSFIDAQIEAKRNELLNIDKRIEVANKMLDILDRYTYGFIELLNIAPTEGGGFKYDGGG